MSTEERVAFIQSQTAMMLAEMEMMKAANVERERNGYALAYGEEQWADFLKQWEGVLGYNSVLSFLKE